jgi:hypothetical protein
LRRERQSEITSPGRDMMIAKNLVHQAILAGQSARFLTAADLILDLTK